MEFDSVLRDVSAFLLANPSETVLMRIKEEGSPNRGRWEFVDFYNDYIRKYPDSLFYTTNSIPTLGQVRGKIVILSQAKNVDGIRWGSAAFDINNEYLYRDPALFDPVSGKLKNVKDFFENTRGSQNTKLFVNQVSATGVRTPGTFAASINPFVADYATKNSGDRLGIVAMDYPSDAAIQAIVYSNPPRIMK
jgi:1-phosphatidylinositol phosphodiesterase